MDKLKRYIECYIATETCNLRCHYCYITQKRKFNNKLVQFEHSPTEIRKALSVKRLGGVCLLNLCAGRETLLAVDLLPIVKELLLEGHYIMIVTNGTLSNRFNEISAFPIKLLKQLVFKLSFHYLELVRVNKLDIFFENIEKIKKMGSSFTVEITPSDELIPYIEEIKKVCMDKLGTLCHITIARDDRTSGIEVLSDYSFEQYTNIWSVFESELFSFKSTIFYKKRKEFCYAGDWSLYLNLSTGKLTQCYWGKELDNIYINSDVALKLRATGKHCSLPHCYNGHAFLTLGVIPELDTPTYVQVRDRTSQMGENWLQPEMRTFMNQKLSDNNEKYSSSEKKLVEIKRLYYKGISVQKKIIEKLKRE